MLRVGPSCPAALLLALLLTGPALAQSFADDFSTNTTASYTLTLIQPAEGTATFVHDAVGQRAEIRAGDDFGLRVAQAVPSRASGRLSLDLLPTRKWPNGGRLFVRLRQDANNYYELANSNGYGPGTLRKVVGGAVVATTSFAAGYVQNTSYHLNLDFGPGVTKASAYGQNLQIDQAAALAITSLEIETYQQTAFLDNLAYGDIVNLAPNADAGPDQVVTDGDAVQLSGTASSDPDGNVASYFWQQLSGPAVSLSNASSASPSFVAPDPGSGNVALVFELTVTDDGGAPDTDTVQITSWSSESLQFSDAFENDSTGSYALTLIEPTRGTATLVHDAVGRRAEIRAGNDFGLRVAHAVPPRTSGRLSVDLLPTRKWPSGGRMFVRLRQDASNYYEISNYHHDGTGVSGMLRKVVGGAVVASASFASGYVQNVAYAITLDFAPGASQVIGFGQSLSIGGNATPLVIQSLEVESYQQTAYFDNLRYGDVINTPPVADAGPDQAAAAGDLVQLDGRASFDPDGTLAGYFWEQLSGPSVALSNPASSTPSFTAPDPGSGHVPLVFRLSVTDNGEAPASDTVSIETWSPAELTLADSFASDTTGSFTLTPVFPENGTGTLVYDAAGQRAQLRTGDNFGLKAARTLPPRRSGRLALTLLPTKKYPNGGQIFVRLIQDTQNYYEIFNSDGYGPGTLAKVVGGQVVEIAAFSTGYVQNQAYPLVFNFSPALSTFEGFGQFFALEATTQPLQITQLEIQVYQQDIFFDDLSLTDFVELPPFVRLTAPVDDVVQSSSTLHAAAFTFRLQTGWRVAFALDAGSPGERVLIDGSAPFALDFAGVEQGTHTLDATVVDAGGSPVPGVGNDQVVDIEIGDYYVGVGDSITRGQGDGLASDNVSLDGRDSGGGYPPVLNDLLSAATGFVNVVKNEGVGGRTSLGAVSRMNAILNAHPNALFFLIQFGTNDSKLATPIPSGVNLQPGDPGYAGSYKANMQSLVSAVLARGKTPILARVPVAYSNTSNGPRYPDLHNAPANVLNREYNQVVEQLTLENSLPLLGPDFYTYFTQHPEHMADRLHPNGLGYRAMAELWRDALLAD